jgi:hypothetical protein
MKKGSAQKYLEKRSKLNNDFRENLPELLGKVSKEVPGLYLLELASDGETFKYRLGRPGYVEVYPVNDSTAIIRSWPPKKMDYSAFIFSLSPDNMVEVARKLARHGF